MTEQVSIRHRHDDGEEPMLHVDDERIDGLRLREFTCRCGFSAAVLTRVAEERQGERWPFAFRTPSIS